MSKETAKTKGDSQETDAARRNTIWTSDTARHPPSDQQKSTENMTLNISQAFSLWLVMTNSCSYIKDGQALGSLAQRDKSTWSWYYWIMKPHPSHYNVMPDQISSWLLTDWTHNPLYSHSHHEVLFSHTSDHAIFQCCCDGVSRFQNECSLLSIADNKHITNQLINNQATKYTPLSELSVVLN